MSREKPQRIANDGKFTVTPVDALPERVHPHLADMFPTEAPENLRDPAYLPASSDPPGSATVEAYVATFKM